MKRSLLGSALVFALLMTLAGGAARPAEAGDWFVGGAFSVGGLHFSLAFDRHHRYPHADPYYRTRHRVHYDGYRCGSYCFKRSGYSYHHSSCALVLHHFRRHDFHPGRAWGLHRTPGYDRYYDRGRYYGHRDYGRRHPGHRDYGRRDYGRRDYRYRDDDSDYRYRGDYRDYHRGHDPRSCPYR